MQSETTDVDHKGVSQTEKEEEFHKWRNDIINPTDLMG